MCMYVNMYTHIHIYIYIHINIYTYIYIHTHLIYNVCIHICMCIYIVAYTKGLDWVIASLNPIQTLCEIVFLAPTYKPPLSIVISSLLCYIISVFEISFSGMGLRPLILVSHFFNMKFNQPSKTKEI